MTDPAQPPIRARDRGLSRARAIDPQGTALLVVDVQNATFNEAQETIRPQFFSAARDIVIPNLQRLVSASRARGVEVIYTVMENLTRDGRDRSLDYKLSDFFIAKGSWEAKVIDALAPGEDEIVLPKTSSSLFNSTNLDYLLRNIGIGCHRVPHRPVHRPYRQGRGRQGLLRHLPHRRLHGQYLGTA